MAVGDRLGELLVRENLISLAQLQKAEQDRRDSGERLGYTLTKLGYLEETELTQFLSKTYGVPSIKLDELEIKKDVVDLVPRDMALRHLCIPVNRAGSTLIVAMADPANLTAIDDLKFLTNYSIEVVVASEVSIRGAIAKYYMVQNQRQAGTMDDILGELEEDDVELEKSDAGAFKLRCGL
jgi:type IV pilus assembly protein PilB